MTQGISASLNLALSRVNMIENNFATLERIMSQNMPASNEVQAQAPKQDFQKILEAKIEEKTGKKEALKEIFDLEEKIEEISPEKKEAINLKSKIDLQAQANDVDEIIDTFALKYNVDADLIKAIIKQESGFNPKATSKKGAMGLMQLMPQTAESLGVVNAYNPWENVEGGVKYFKKLLKQYDNNKELALAAYNAGPTAVKRYGGIPPYKETQNYVNSIMSTYQKVKEAKI